MTILLLPQPRELQWLTGSCPADGPVLETIDPTLPTEGYVLRINDRGIHLRSADNAGRHHGLATLAQLRTQVNGSLPALEIRDHPRFSLRGLMLDISRDRIPTLAELRQLIGQMAAWKMNHLQLYCEHAIAYEGHAEVTGPAEAIPLAELRQLSEEAAALGVCLSPNQNCFGHMERWFRHPRYEPLAEQAGDPGPHHHSGPRALAPALPQAMDLVRDLVGQLCATLPAEVVNIGGDETWDLGRGRSRDLVEAEGYATVYGRFLGQIMATVRGQGRTPAFWADIVLQHPEAIPQLDIGAIALDWGYGGCHDFNDSQRRLREAGFKRRWICPGSACWSTWGGHSDERRANLIRAVRAAEQHEAEGLLLTVWGDGGHRQIWPASLAGIAEAAQRFWCGSEQAYEPRAGGLHAFGCAELGPWLDELGQLDRPLRDGSRWQTTYRALHEGAPRQADRPYICNGAIEPQLSSASEWAAVAAASERLGQRLPPACNPQFAAECRHALNLIHLGAERGIETCGGSRRPADWAQRLDKSVAEHRRLWRLRARNGGLEDSAAAFYLPLG